MWEKGNILLGDIIIRCGIHTLMPQSKIFCQIYNVVQLHGAGWGMTAEQAALQQMCEQCRQKREQDMYLKKKKKRTEKLSAN